MSATEHPADPISDTEYATLGRHLVNLLATSHLMGHANAAGTIQYIEPRAASWPAQLVLDAFGACRPRGYEDHREAVACFLDTPAGQAAIRRVATAAAL